MAVSDNQHGTSNFPGGVNINVPDLTIARPIDTIVEVSGALFRSTHATIATYAAISPSGYSLGDLASGTAIDASASGTYTITTTGGGETATLPDPVRVGQELSFYMVVDGGGNMVITATTRITYAAASTVMTFADVGDYLVLRSVALPLGGVVWQLMSNTGVALT